MLGLCLILNRFTCKEGLSDQLHDHCTGLELMVHYNVFQSSQFSFCVQLFDYANITFIVAIQKRARSAKLQILEADLFIVEDHKGPCLM